MITIKHIRTIFAMTSIFESGAIGNYSAVGILPDDAGISYGRHQATDRSNSLDEIIWKYIDLKGTHAFSLKPFLKHLKDDESAINPDAPWVKQLMDLLKDAASDPLMQKAQDEVFSDKYWTPAYDLGEHLGLIYPLSYAILYDISIQSGIGRIAKLRSTFEESPPLKGGDEQEWSFALSEARYDWLRNYASSDPKKQRIVRSTADRAFVYMGLCTGNQWNLPLPMEIKKVIITESTV